MLKAIARNRALIFAFAQRDFQSRYRSSFIGWAWSLIAPLAFIAMFAVVFSFVFRVTAPPAGGTGQSIYVLFLFVAMVAWNAFVAVTNSGMIVIRDVASLLKKVYFPPFAPVLGATLVIIVQVVLEFVALMIALLIGQNFSWTWIYGPFILLLLIIFAQGVGFVTAAISAKFGDVQQIYSILLQALYFLTPILYPISLIPSEGVGLVLQTIAKINPLYWYIDAMRISMYELQPVPPLLLVGLTAGSLLMFIIGWFVFQKRSTEFTEEL